MSNSAYLGRHRVAQVSVTARVTRTGATAVAAGTAVAAASVGLIAAPAGAATPHHPIRYTVRSGDTLDSIATAHHLTGGWLALAELNRAIIVDPNYIYPGERITLSTASTKRNTQRSPRRRISPQASSPVSSGASPRTIAARMVHDRGWDSAQYTCLVRLWNRESGWKVHAYNSSGGAYGIPQALPGSKMSAAGSNWRDSARTQITWGLDYISGRYGNPCGAWAHSQSHNWY